MREHTKLHASVLVLALVTVAACGRMNGGPGAANGKNVPPSSAASSVVEAIAPNGTGNPVALAKVRGRRVAFVADADARALLTVDAATRQQIATTDVGGAPSQVYVARDGRVFVTVRDTSKLLVLEASQPDMPLVRKIETTTAAEPVALALGPDEGTVYVSCGWGQKLTAHDAKTLAPKFAVALPREPRGVVISDDGTQAFVSHSVGSVVTVVDLAKQSKKELAMRGPNPQATEQAVRMRKATERMGKMTKTGITKDQFASLAALDKRAELGRASCQGFVLAKSASIPNRIFAPQVMVDPGDPDARPSGYGEDQSIPEMPAVAVIDEGAAAPLATSMGTRNGAHERQRKSAERTVGPAECLLPRSAAIDPQTQSLLVACFGIDSVIAYDGRAASPGLTAHRTWSVGAGPTGIAVDPQAREAIVFSQFDRTISTVSLADLDQLPDEKDGPVASLRTPLPSLRETMPSEILVGRMLFHSSGDPRISDDGRACASCHPDGRDDAITWATPDGPRRSITLAGRVAKTGPYSWDGNAKTIDKHLHATFSRLKGEGLRNFEREALIAYITSLPTPPPRTIEGHDKAVVDRGQAIFNSVETQCTTCHNGPMLTDGMNHDVGSRRPSDVAMEFNTPSLRLIGGTGPYFHDGRYADMRDLLRQSDGKMGHTKHLSNADLDALAVYLETL